MKVYQYIKDSAINEELKKNNVDMQEFEDVDLLYSRNWTSSPKEAKPSRKTLRAESSTLTVP